MTLTSAADVMMTSDGDYVAICDTAAEAREAIAEETGEPCLFVHEVGIRHFRVTKAMVESGEFDWDPEPGDRAWEVVRGGTGAWMVGFDAPLWRQEPLPPASMHWSEIPVGTICYYKPEGHGRVIAPPRTWRASGKPVFPVEFENGAHRELFLGQIIMFYGGPLAAPEPRVRVFVGDDLVCDGCSSDTARLMIDLRETRLRLEWEAEQFALLAAEETHESQTGTSAQEGEGNWEYRMRHAHGTRWSDWSTREPPPTPGWVVEKQWVQHDITPVETQPSDSGGAS